MLAGGRVLASDMRRAGTACNDKVRGEMNFLLRCSRAVDWISFRIGKLMGWLVFVAVLVSSLNAMSRYLFNASSNAWLELQWYLFGAVVLLGAAYTLLQNEHIRIDIVNARLQPRTRYLIDIFGHVFFLLPICLLMVWLGIPFFLRSLASGEVSASAGGLIIWPAKLLIPAGFILLLAQALSELVKRIAVLQGRIPDPYVNHGTHGQSAEVPDQVPPMRASSAASKH